MSSTQNFNTQFVRADANHDGTIDEKEFRQFLGPVVRDERRLSGNITQQDIKDFNVSYFFKYLFVFIFNNKSLIHHPMVQQKQ
jgi:hypothetical protein